MLTRLPEVLSIELLSNWCDLKTVGKMDSAFCNRNDRWDFLGLLDDATFASIDSKYRSSNSFWRWIVLNGIKLQHVKGMWCEKMSDSQIAKIDCSKVIEFHVDKLIQVKLVAELINKSINLKILKVFGFLACANFERTNEIISLVSDQILSNLTNLTIRGRRRESNQNALDLTNVANACTELRSLSVLKDDCGVSEHSLIQLIRNNKHLKRLTLYGCVCRTALMTAIELNCAELQSLTIADLQMGRIVKTDCSIEAVCAILSNNKQLTFCSLGGDEGFRFSIQKDQRVSIVAKHNFTPAFSPIFDMHHNKLSVIRLSGRIQESLLVQISLKCPHLTELSILERRWSWSEHALRCIVTRCTKLEILRLSYVDATYDEMMTIFCSNKPLVLKTLDVCTTTPYRGLSAYIRNNNRGIVNCSMMVE